MLIDRRSHYADNRVATVSMSQSGPPVPAREVLTPSMLTRLVRDLLEDAFPLIWLEGEISNFTRSGPGHLYFTLKDMGAQVRCAMFKPRSTWLRFKPADGMHVVARGRVTLYEQRGEFQLVVEHLEEAGEGALRREFERLKAQLAAEGLFEAARKRPVPRFARRIGVVTSPSGAAIRDVLSVIARRFPLANVELLAIPVQGRDAPPVIARVIAKASRAGRHDVLLLTRGGGSLEDLWAFNDEAVARAIHASAIPVVSAIGHEIDFTIADFVADLRAPTPSAAAELIVPDAADLARLLERDRRRLAHCMARKLQSLQQRVDHAFARLHAQRPQARLARARERARSLEQQLRSIGVRAIGMRSLGVARLRARLTLQDPLVRLARQDERARTLSARLRTALVRTAERRALRLAELARTLNAVSPLATLDRGYAILLDRPSGHVVRSVSEIDTQSKLRARLADGDIDLRIDTAE